MEFILRPVAAAALAAALLTAAMSSYAQAPQAPAARREPPAAGLIVKFRDSATRSPAATAAALDVARAGAALRGLQVVAERENAHGARVLRFDRRVPAGLARQLAQELAAADASVEYVEPDTLMRLLFTPNDPRYAEQWNLFEATGGVNAPGAWDLSQGSGARVAVLDTGVLPHADLAANLIAGYDFITDAWTARDGNGRDTDARDPGNWADPFDCGWDEEDEYTQASVWHGTHVAGIVAAVGHNASGISGVAPKARVQSVRVLGRCGGATSDVADAIVWASGGAVPNVPANASPARILNLSLGSEQACSITHQSAVDKAVQAGALVVVAAGNDSQNVSLQAPANCKGVLAVAATHRQGGRASYSNFGTGVGIAAPGGTGIAESRILSTYNSGWDVPMADSMLGMNGTSMAAPHVAGVAALMFSVNSFMTAKAAAEIMKETARAFPQSCGGCGAGIVDAAKAVSAARGFRLEKEPNGTLSTAQYLNVFPADVRGDLHESISQDLDLYSVWLPHGATLSATLAPPSSFDMNLSLHDAAGKTMKVSNKGGAGVQESITHTNATGQGVMLYLMAYRGPGSLKAWSPQAYRLRVSR